MRLLSSLSASGCRVVAEGGRVVAEGGRVVAEGGRVEAKGTGAFILEAGACLALLFLGSNCQPMK